MGADRPRELCSVSYYVELPHSELQNFNFKILPIKSWIFKVLLPAKFFPEGSWNSKFCRKNPPGRILNLRKILKIRDLAKKTTSQQFCWQNLDFFLYDHDFGSLSPCLIPFQSEVRERENIEQGHPTTIFGKYLFGRRFEIRIFGTFVVKFLTCLPLLGFSNI